MIDKIPSQYRLTKTQLEQFTKVRPVLEHAEKLTGVPWRAIASVWYRESFSVASPKTPGGPFQFDPIPPHNSLYLLLKRYVRLPDQELHSLAVKGVNDFPTAAILAACWLRNKVGPVIRIDASDDLIKDAFYGYNGRAYGPVDKSPYVMNGIDEAHKKMKLRGTIPDDKGGRKKISTEDLRPGAYTVYVQLRELLA